jgi:hypothetical protein
MPKNIVVMPTLRRPEMLALALEKLYAARAYKLAEVHIYLDDAASSVLDEVDFVRDNYYPAAQIFQANSHPEAPSGCWNILNSLKAGYDSGSEFVFLVEEDVMVTPDYFNWHRRAWENDWYEPESGPIFASCGRYLDRYGRNHYTNPGSCFHKSSLEKIVPHICDDFFADRRGYMDKTFGPMDEASDLDDGLIRRVCRQQHGTLAWPTKPVAYHQRFYAYQRFAEYKNEGNIQTSIANLRQMLPKLDCKNRYTRDWEAFPEDV